EFETEYIVTYESQANGETLVNYDISIINSKADVIATKYSLAIKKVEVYDVLAKDKRGDIKVQTDTKDDTTTITVELDDQAIGINKKNNFSIEYKTKNITTKVGEVWNVNIPQVQNIESTNKYDVSLILPTSLGPKIYVSPTPSAEKNDNFKYYLEFHKKDLLNTGISASFGSYQVMNFQLKYQLKNDTVFTQIQEIALPADKSDQQKVYFKSIDPAPIRVREDRDGNILASFQIPSKDTLEVKVTGSARILGRQIAPSFGSKINKLPGDLVSKYTKTQKYWETNSEEIETISNSLLSKDASVSVNAGKAYEYVINTLDYDFNLAKLSSVERKGAINSLKTPAESACMEFTDLFVAITRAMGIPARELNGYAFSSAESLTPISINLTSGDLLHSWAEFYDPEYGWVAVDPTWGATSGMDYFTKLDTNHFAFVTKGINSEYPLPAGLYRLNDTDKMVEIDFSQDQTVYDPVGTSSFDQAKAFAKPQKVSMVQLGGVVIACIVFFGLGYLLIGRRVLRKSKSNSH
ncbi:MAG: Transglutaminase protein, partial [uncultured bacterium]